jgi:hypothetical protein
VFNTNNFSLISTFSRSTDSCRLLSSLSHSSVLSPRIGTLHFTFHPAPPPVPSILSYILFSVVNSSVFQGRCIPVTSLIDFSSQTLSPLQFFSGSSTLMLSTSALATGPAVPVDLPPAVQRTSDSPRGVFVSFNVRVNPTPMSAYFVAAKSVAYSKDPIGFKQFGSSNLPIPGSVLTQTNHKGAAAALPADVILMTSIDARHIPAILIDLIPCSFLFVAEASCSGRNLQKRSRFIDVPVEPGRVACSMSCVRAAFRESLEESVWSECFLF